MDIFEGLKTTDCLICLEPLLEGLKDVDHRSWAMSEVVGVGGRDNDDEDDDNSNIGVTALPPPISLSSSSPRVRFSSVFTNHVNRIANSTVEDDSGRRDESGSRVESGRRGGGAQSRKRSRRSEERENDDDDDEEEVISPSATTSTPTSSSVVYSTILSSSSSLWPDSTRDTPPSSQSTSSHEHSSASRYRGRRGVLGNGGSEDTDNTVIVRCEGGYNEEMDDADFHSIPKRNGAGKIPAAGSGRGLECYSSTGRRGCASSFPSPFEYSFSLALSNVVVLPCGHLFHYLCFTQLAEYNNTSSGCQCPVCRLPIVDHHHEVVRLHLRPRPSCLTPTGSTIAHGTSTTDAEGTKGGGEIIIPTSTTATITATGKTRGEAVKKKEEKKGKRKGVSLRGQVDGAALLSSSFVSSGDNKEDSDSVVVVGQEVEEEAGEETTPETQEQGNVEEKDKEGEELLAPSPYPPQGVEKVVVEGGGKQKEEREWVMTTRDVQKLHKTPSLCRSSCRRVGDAMSRKDSSGDVILLWEDRIDPAKAYCQLLRRLSLSCEERRERLQSRSFPLSRRYEQLQEDVQELRNSSTTAKRRLDLLRGSGTAEEWGELLSATQDLKYMLDCCTAELAAATRESQSLDVQLGRYKNKIDALIHLGEERIE